MPETTEREWLESEGVRPSKRLGQNFLLDRKICGLIAQRAGWAAGDRIFEIGAGAGALTEALLTAGLRVHAVERDARLLPILRRRFAGALDDGRLTLEESDALTIEWTQRARELGWSEPGSAAGAVWVAGNLPYTITTPLLVSALRASSILAGAVFMVQREYGDRLAAAPGSKTYGSITVWARAHGETRTLLRVGRSAFWPRPGVESSVIELRFPQPPPYAGDTARLERVLRATFGQRRKTVLNALASGWPLPKEDALGVLQRAQIDPGVRAERLALEDFARLTDAFGEDA